MVTDPSAVRSASKRDADRPVEVDGRRMTIADVEAVARQGRTARLARSALPGVEASRAIVSRIVADDRPAYGITTGFGALSDQAISVARTKALQANLLRSHASGAGDPLPTGVVRAAMLLRANSLARGHSGVRPVVIERLLDLLNAGITPVVPCQGSLGASGDLAPLAHLSLPLISAGTVEVDGHRREAAQAMGAVGIEPIELEPKEALALINGTQVMTALGLLALLDAERLLESAVVIAALSCCALAARRAPFDPRIHEVRPHPGQVAVAATLRELLSESPEPEPLSKRLQDAYSIRCIPQVYGGITDALAGPRRAVEIEINAATDNPLLFDDGSVISGGNFHGHPLALGFDAAKIAVASLGAIVERRIALMVDGEVRGLPPCLVPDAGLNSGYMIAHYLTAGLVAENRVLAHPSSVDSIPTSAGVEDYNSMGATAARHFRQIVTNVEMVVAVEAICAAQACDLASRVPTGRLGRLHRRIRERVPSLQSDDRVVADDVATSVDLLRAGTYRE
ncbi:MAG: histidine ammonia-lyase [Thermomicrobiales bacterium]